MPFHKLLVHMVWATKNRYPFLEKEQKDAICQHLRENASAKNMHLLNVNGHVDHVHALISYRPDQNSATIAHLLKGESSFWANRHLEFPKQFGWQDEYFAVSVSGAEFAAVYAYISNQETHHRHKTFQDEYEELMDKYGFDESGEWQMPPWAR